MLDLFDEFKHLIATLEREHVEYALCGGLAMAVYGLPRATVDIDVIIRANDLERARDLARVLGYTIDAAPMSFHDGDVQIRRVSKIEASSGDLLMIDFLLVTPAIEPMFNARQALAWEYGAVSVVSRDGLIALKRLRQSGQDLDDIKRLEADDGG